MTDVVFCFVYRDVNEAVEVKRAERARREDKERGDAERARLASIAGSNSSEVAPRRAPADYLGGRPRSRTGPRTLKNQVTRNANGATSRRRRRRTPRSTRNPATVTHRTNPASHKGSHDELTTNDIIAVKRLKRGEESDSSNDEPVVAALDPTLNLPLYERLPPAPRMGVISIEGESDLSDD